MTAYPELPTPPCPALTAQPCILPGVPCSSPQSQLSCLCKADIACLPGLGGSARGDWRRGRYQVSMAGTSPEMGKLFQSNSCRAHPAKRTPAARAPQGPGWSSQRKPGPRQRGRGWVPAHCFSLLQADVAGSGGQQHLCPAGGALWAVGQC